MGNNSPWLSKKGATQLDAAALVTPRAAARMANTDETRIRRASLTGEIDADRPKGSRRIVVRSLIRWIYRENFARGCPAPVEGRTLKLRHDPDAFDPDVLFKGDEIGLMLKCSREELTRISRSGRLPHYMVDGHLWARIADVQAVRAWLFYERQRNPKLQAAD